MHFTGNRPKRAWLGCQRPEFPHFFYIIKHVFGPVTDILHLILLRYPSIYLLQNLWGTAAIREWGFGTFS